MSTLNESVSWKTNDSMLVIEKRAMIVNNDTLHLHNGNYKVQNYQWQIVSNNLDFPGRTGFLVDRYAGTVSPLDMAGTTTVNFSVQNIVASYAADRFKIVFNQVITGPLPVTFTGIAASANTDKTHTVKWFVSNELNLAGYVIERSGNGVRFDAIGNAAVAGTSAYSFIDASPLGGVNFYRVKATSANGQVQYSAIVKLSSADVKPGFSIQPNPVVNKTLHINFENMKGSYRMKLLSKQGASVFTKQINVASLNEVQHILIEGIAAGVYDVVLVDAKGKQTVQTVFVQ
jgi:hypothetical protein